MANTVTMMKKDAIINLQIGTGFLQRIQQVLTALVSEHTEEELDQFTALVEKGQTTDFPEQWMDHLFVLSAFVRQVESEAIKQGATYDQDMSNINVADN
jgi:hypothetical protein